MNAQAPFFTATVENLTIGLAEWRSYHRMHWEELALQQDKIPLDPDYGEYLRRDALGMITYVALREKGRLVGYYVGFTAPGLHYKSTLIQHQDIFFVNPEHRKGGGGRILFNEVERELRRRGVLYWIMGSKKHLDATGFFASELGAEPIETICAKVLD